MTITCNITGVYQPYFTGLVTVGLENLPPFVHKILHTDLNAIFFTHFAETAQYSHAGETPESYQVLFDDPQTDVSVGREADYTSTRPQIQIAERVLTRAIKKQDKVRIRGKAYFVEEYASDGHGVVTAFLRLA
jgi:hypothetical protein